VIPPLTPEEFVEWLKEAGKTRTFWTKPLTGISFEESARGFVFKVLWAYKRRERVKAEILISREVSEGLSGRAGVRILILPKGLEPPNYDQRSCIYIWKVPSRTLEPNDEVEIRRYEDWKSDDIFREVQRRSWGFYLPPRLGDHLVLVATLSGKPVGLAYLNVHNFNIDYGVHVVRDLWRRRIGTRLLAEALNSAEEMGASYLTVFRWLRRGSNNRDRAAMSFYEANNPGWSYMAYRIP